MTGAGTVTVVNPTDATVTPSTLTLNVGDTYNLGYKVYPTNVTYTVEWACYKPEIATVDRYGKVTAVGPGSVSVSLWVFDKDGGCNIIRYCDVTVVPNIQLDENATEAPVAAENVNVTVNRTLLADRWSTICLPFAMTEAQVKAAFGDEAELADFTGYNAERDADNNVINISINFSIVTKIEANHPYLIKVKDNITEFIAEDVDVVPIETPKVSYDSSTDAYGSFIGTYTADTPVPNNCLFISNNQFLYSTGNTKLKAYQAYFDLHDVLTEQNNSSIHINMMYGDMFIKPEAYAVYNDSTLTFYYDKVADSRTGEKYEMNKGWAPGWYEEHCADIAKVVFDKSFANARPTSTWEWFAVKSMGESALTTIEGIEYLNTSEVKYMKNMFNGCSKLTAIDLSGFNTSQVTRMDGMFSGCSSLTTLNLSNFDTSNVIIMNGMFDNCSSLSSLNLINFDTRKVNGMKLMFQSCSKLKTIDLRSFDTSNVTDMSHMFDGCKSLTSLNFGGFNTEKVTTMRYMFQNCRSLANIDLSGFSTGNVQDMYYMFNLCTSLKSLNLTSFNTENVIIRCGMFRNCSSLTSLEISSFDTSNDTEMYGMFYGCTNLISLDLSSFDTSNVTHMDEMFYGCKNLITIYCGEKWNTRNVTNSTYMFSGCTNLVGGSGTMFDASHTDASYACIDGGVDNPGYFTLKVLKTIEVDEMAFYINNDGSVTQTGADEKVTTGDFVIPTEVVVNDVVYSVTSISDHAFENCTGMISVTIPKNVTHIGDSAFAGCSGLEEIYCLNPIPIDFGTTMARSFLNVRYRVAETRQNQFGGVNFDTCILYVPEGSVELYRQAIVWGAFKHIIGIETPIIIPKNASVTPSALTLNVGDTCTLGYKVYPTKSTYTIEWACLNPEILTIDNYGKVTAVGPGSVSVSLWVFDKDGGCNIIRYCDVTVVPNIKLDENATEAPVAAENVNVTVNRTLLADRWSTICLPFAMTEAQVKAAFGDEAELADFTGYSTTKDVNGRVTGLSVNFADVVAMEANHPYIIKVKEQVDEFTVNGVDMTPVVTPQLVYDNGMTGGDREIYSYFAGTYTANTYVPENCLVISGNRFWYSVGNTKMQAFRGYFYLQEVLSDLKELSDASRICFVFDNKRTGIIETESDSFKRGKCYDLQGQPVKTMKKGSLYIMDGKKIKM